MSRFAGALRTTLRRLMCINGIHPDDDDSDSSDVGTPTDGVIFEGGIKNIGHLSFTFGCTDQTFFPGSYSGLQCTTMALASIIQNESTPIFTPPTINKILSEGNRLHTLLRDVIKLSNVSDGRIAVEDIPHRRFMYLGFVFGKITTVKLQQECEYVFTSKKDGFNHFLTIKEYLKRWRINHPKTRTGFLITLNGSSYSVILRGNGRVALFDSHGHLTVHGELIEQKAGLLQFTSLDYLEIFLKGMYGSETAAVIAPVKVQLIQLFGPDKVDTKQPQPSAVPYNAYLSTEIEENAREIDDNIIEPESKAIIDDDCSPFIGMMRGGF